jgi:hypothetical protein
VALSRSLRNEPLTLLVLGLLGAAVASGVTFGDMVWSAWSADATKFARQAETVLWFVAVVTQFVLWVEFQAPMWSMAKRVKRGERWTASLAGLFILGGVVGGVVYVASTLDLDYPLPEHDLKLFVVTSVGLLATVPGVLTIWRVQRLAGALEADVGKPGWEELVGGKQHPVDALADLRDVLDRTLLLLGLILGAAVVSAALFRVAVIAWYPPVEESQDPVISTAYVFLYGAGFTLVLVALYSAARARVVALFETAVAALVPIKRESGEVDKQLETRATYRKELKLDTPLGTSLTAGIGLLTPIFSGLLGLIDLN